MSGSNKSWLTLAALVLVVAGVIYATKQLNRRPAPRAEITPTTLTSDAAPPPSRTHFPTILRAKPVTEAEAASSPRYEPRDTSDQMHDQHFGKRPAASFLPPATDFPPAADGLPNSELPPAGYKSSIQDNPPTAGSQPTETGSPAFREPPQTDDQSSLPDVRDSQSAGNSPAAASPAGDIAASDVAASDNTAADVSAADISAANLSAADLSAAPESTQAGPPQENVSGDMPSRYVTQTEDSFWNISKQRYGGEGRFFKALYYHNRYRILRPDQIPAGIEIDTPPLAELKRLYPDLCRPAQRR